MKVFDNEQDIYMDSHNMREMAMVTCIHSPSPHRVRVWTFPPLNIPYPKAHAIITYEATFHSTSQDLYKFLGIQFSPWYHISKHIVKFSPPQIKLELLLISCGILHTHTPLNDPLLLDWYYIKLHNNYLNKKTIKP